VLLKNLRGLALDVELVNRDRSGEDNGSDE